MYAKNEWGEKYQEISLFLKMKGIYMKGGMEET